jgi:hypothetical protein
LQKKVWQRSWHLVGIDIDQLNHAGLAFSSRHCPVKNASVLTQLFGLSVRRVPPAKSAIFIELKLIRRGSLVLGCRIIFSFAFRACKGNNDSHLMDSPLLIECKTLNQELFVIGYLLFVLGDRSD